MDYLIIRLLCAFLSGVLLSFAGSLTQLSTKNILASPSTLGIDGLTTLWVLVLHSLGIWFGFDPAKIMMISGIPVFVMLGLFYSRALTGRDELERVILLGITFNLFVGAIFSLWQFFFMAFNLPFPVEVWFGHFRNAHMNNLISMLIGTSALMLGFFTVQKELRLYSLSSHLARNFHLRRQSLFATIFIISVCSTFLVVSLFGVFSFLGLIFPIMARKLWFQKFDLKGEFYLGSVVNGIILMLVDYLCYAFPIMGAEVPVGLLVTAVGAVSLILLLWRGKQGPQLLAKFRK